MFTSLLQQISEYVQAGGWVMPPLLVFTLLLWFAIGYRFAALKRGTKRGVRNLLARAEKGKKASDTGIMIRAMKKGIKLRQQASGQDLRPLLDDAFFEEERELNKFNVLITSIVLSRSPAGFAGNCHWHD